MAWRPNRQLIEGVLDNTAAGKITGWMSFSGLDEKVIFELEGNFHRDIRGAKVKLKGSIEAAENKGYLEGFALLQKGKAGDMTAGREPVDYVDYPYFEWYGEANGRVVLELDPEQVELLTKPIPACESEPISRSEQNQNMAQFLCDMSSELNIPQRNCIAVGQTKAVETSKLILANDKRRGMKLLTKDIRQTLPALYGQEGKGGKAVAIVKYFYPAGNWSWHATEGEPVTDETGAEIDFRFFGLVEGLDKELGYFLLSELAIFRDKLGLVIERDLYWKPATLEKIAPEMF